MEEPSRSVVKPSLPPSLRNQALLLVKAITLFNASAQTPVGIDFLSDGVFQDSHVGQQSQDAVLKVDFDYQGPQFLVGFWQAGV